MGRATDATRAVTQSANSIAALRAVESERADGLMKDPWARELAGARAMARADARRGEDGDKGRIAVRTKFFDDFVTAAAGKMASARGETTQVVLLGAGYDTRSWRLRAASEEARERTSVYEVDVEEVLARKREVVSDAPLTLGAERREVASDIAKDDWVAALKAAGMSTELPTVWVLEGLLYYLSPRCAKKTLALCHRSCGPGSVVAVSVVRVGVVGVVAEPERVPARALRRRFAGYPVKLADSKRAPLFIPRVVILRDEHDVPLRVFPADVPRSAAEPQPAPLADRVEPESSVFPNLQPGLDLHDLPGPLPQVLRDELAELDLPEEADPLRVFSVRVGQPRPSRDVSNLRLR